MKYYIGCDVSLKAISVCVMEGSGKRILRQDIAASPETLLMVIKPYFPHCLVGLEAGSTTSWLFHGLQKAGVKVVCMEAHHARKALSSQPVKTDRNDAEGLAQLLRTGWYKSVHVKQEDTQELKCWVEARETLKHKQQDIKNAIRGLVKPFGDNIPQWGRTCVDRAGKEASYA